MIEPYLPELIRLCNVSWETMERLARAGALERLELTHAAQEAILRVRETLERFAAGLTDERPEGNAAEDGP